MTFLLLFTEFICSEAFVVDWFHSWEKFMTDESSFSNEYDLLRLEKDLSLKHSDLKDSGRSQQKRMLFPSAKDLFLSWHRLNWSD